MTRTSTRKRKRRIRSPHPGVVLIKPDDSHPYWRARCTDPDTGGTVKVRLDPLAIPTAEARREWAIKRAKAQVRRHMDLEAGAPRATGLSVKDVVTRYFDAHPKLRARTRAIYRRESGKLVAWAERAGVKSADDLTRGMLVDFRKELVRAPKRVAAAGGKRGETQAAAEPRSARAINHELGSVRTVVRWLRDADLLPKVSHDDIRRALKLEKVTREQPEFLRPAECQALLAAAIRHDSATMITREEEEALREEARAKGISRKALARARPEGTTPRHKPVAPLVLFCLLTGCRAGEAFALRWTDVDVESADPDGHVVGEIRLRGTSTKTGHARTITLDVSPSVRALLVALHEKKGDAAYVFGGKKPLTAMQAEAARQRLLDDYDAPPFTWQVLRSTCATFQCNAPALWGAAAAFVSAKRLGHSVAVAEKHYAGLYAVSRTARTLETAMTIEELAGDVVARAGGSAVAGGRQ